MTETPALTDGRQVFLHDLQAARLPDETRSSIGNSFNFIYDAFLEEQGDEDTPRMPSPDSFERLLAFMEVCSRSGIAVPAPGIGANPEGLFSVVWDKDSAKGRVRKIFKFGEDGRIDFTRVYLKYRNGQVTGASVVNHVYRNNGPASARLLAGLRPA